MKHHDLPALLITVLLILWGCKGEDLLGQGTLVVGLEANPTNLDPRLSTDAASSRINELLYSRLFRKNEAGEPVVDIVVPDEVSKLAVFLAKQTVNSMSGQFIDFRDWEKDIIEGKF